jgi:hypothetical protein
MKEKIISALIEKGGIYGHVAKTYGHLQQEGDEVIKECFEQCHNSLAFEMWGPVLVAEIVRYRSYSLRQELKNVTLLLYQIKAKRAKGC